MALKKDIKSNPNTVIREALHLYRTQGEITPEMLYRHLKPILDLDARHTSTDLKTIEKLLVKAGWSKD